MRRYFENRHRDFAAAQQLRETFVDRPMERVDELRWKWPATLDEVGSCVAVQYQSNKWQRRRGDYDDYKHLAEGPQRLLLHPDFDLRAYVGHDQPPLYAESARLDDPPDAIAVLGDLLGLQVEFDDAHGEPCGTRHQINIVRAKLGGARHPTTGEVFLVVYTRDHLCAVVIGDILDIQRDGITG